MIFISSCKKDNDEGNIYPISQGCFTNISNWNGLLPDSLLSTRPLELVPQVDPKFVNWLGNKYNRLDIHSLTSTNFSDLQCLKQYLDNKDLVELGESSHGTKEYSQVKVRLIKFLHEEMGFDVIAFESGLYDCFYTNENIQQFTADDALRNSIFFIWGTPDLEDLFTYIKETYNTNHPLILAGFDCQFSSYLNSILKHPAFLYSIISTIDHSYALQQRMFDSLTIQNILSWNISYLSKNNDSIKYTYSQLVYFIDKHLDTLISSFQQNKIYPLLLRQTLTSILADVDFILASNNSLSGSPDSYKIRDSAMAANVSFLKEKVYPQKKMIIWAHNYHIANSQYLHALYPDVKVMGCWLHDKYKPNIYSIGLYMLRGKTKTEWDWSIIDVQPPTSPYSLEAILYWCRKKYLFIDILNQTYCQGNKWMYSTLTAKTSGFANESMVLKNTYDGIIFIDSSSVPIYLPKYNVLNVESKAGKNPKE